MPDYLLDSTVVIDFLRGKKETITLIKKLFSEGSSLSCCPINIIEVYTGMREKERQSTEEFLNSLEYYDLTKEIAKQAGEYRRSYRKKGITLSLPDVVIAAIAIANNLLLLTDNREHYPMPELNLKTQIEMSRYRI